MSRRNITVGKYQFTEAFVFIGFLALMVGGFLLNATLNDQSLWSAVASSSACRWDESMESTVPHQVGNNLFANPSANTATPSGDAPLNWQVNEWGDIDSSFAYVENRGHGDSTSLRVKVTRVESGDAKWESSQPVSAQPETPYLYRNYYQSNVNTYTIAEITLSDGTKQYINFGLAKPSRVWQELSYTIITPAETVALNVFQVLEQEGWLLTDDYYLARFDPVPLPEGMVSLTFDDGAESIYTNALPLLEKYDLPSTQYIITEPLSKPYNNYHINLKELKGLAKSGHEIASHTVTHQYLPEVGPKRLTYELAQSQVDLYKYLNKTAVNFSSPYGAYTQEVVEEIKRYYCSHRSTDTGFNSPDSFDVYNIRVKNIESKTPVRLVESWIDYAQKHRAWLVLVFHEIEEDGEMYSYTPGDLDEVLKYVKDANVKVATISEAIPIMQETQRRTIPKLMK